MRGIRRARRRRAVAQSGRWRELREWAQALDMWQKVVIGTVAIAVMLFGGVRYGWAVYSKVATKDWTVRAISQAIAEAGRPLTQQLDQQSYDRLLQDYRTNRQRINDLRDRKTLTPFERDALDDLLRAQERTKTKIDDLEKRGFR